MMFHQIGVVCGVEDRYRRFVNEISADATLKCTFKGPHGDLITSTGLRIFRVRRVEQLRGLHSYHLFILDQYHPEHNEIIETFRAQYSRMRIPTKEEFEKHAKVDRLEQIVNILIRIGRRVNFMNGSLSEISADVDTIKGARDL